MNAVDPHVFARFSTWCRGYTCHLKAVLVVPSPVREQKPRPRIPSRRRSRRILFLGLIFVLALNILLAAAMESVMPQWRDPEYGHRLHQLRDWQAQNRPLVIAIGSSRSQMGLSPAHMLERKGGGPIVYNFGQAAAGPVQMALTLRRLRDDGVKPSFVLLEYMAPAFIPDAPVEELMKPWMPKLSRADLRRLDAYSEDRSRLTAAWASTRFNPWHSMRFTLMSHWQPGWLPWQQRQDFMWTMQDQYGWLPYPYESIPNEKRQQGLERMRKDFAGVQNFNVGKWPERAFRDMLAECRDAGIPTAIYVMPESPAFRNWYSPESSARSAALLASLAKAAGVPVFNATDGFAEEDFADGHHLMQHGAATFSRRLWHEHLATWTRN